MKIEFHKYLEIMMIIYYLSGKNEDKFLDPFNKSYLDRIESHFGSFKNDMTIELYSKLHENISWTYLVYFAFSLDSDFHFIKNAVNDDEFNELMESIKADIEIFTALIKYFAEKSDFDSFFQIEIENKKREIQLIQENLPDFDIKKEIELDLGFNLNEILNIYSLIHMASQGFEINLKEGRKIVCLISNFSISYAIKNEMLNLMIPKILLHEYSHPIINPIIESYVKKGGELGEKLDKLFYPVVESIIEAFVIHILLKRNLISDNQLESFLIRSKSNNAKFVFEFYDILKQYLNNREKYKNISDFLPELFILSEKIII